MKTLLICMFASLFVTTNVMGQQKNFHDYVVKSIDGTDFDLSSLKGKKVLVVNVASKCGLTPQYKELQELYDKYKDHNFVIIGFPSNNFMGQEPGTNEEILTFCTLNYDVKFPMMEKIAVKGKNIAPVYEWLTKKELNGKENAKVTWNFQKFMIDENGNWVGSISPRTSPLTEEIINWINSGQ